MDERWRVVKAHRASFDEPIAVHAGDTVTAGRRDATWADYVWCAGPDGREGWVPETFLEPARDASAEDGTTVRRARRDYDARELDAACGDVVLVRETVGGWSWCEAPDGRRGWVPRECVAPRGNEDP